MNLLHRRQSTWGNTVPVLFARVLFPLTHPLLQAYALRMRIPMMQLRRKTSGLAWMQMLSVLTFINYRTDTSVVCHFVIIIHPTSKFFNKTRSFLFVQIPCYDYMKEDLLIKTVLNRQTLFI